MLASPTRHRPIRRAPDALRAWRRELVTRACLATGRYVYAPPLPALRAAHRIPLVWRRRGSIGETFGGFGR